MILDLYLVTYISIYWKNYNLIWIIINDQGIQK